MSRGQKKTKKMSSTYIRLAVIYSTRNVTESGMYVTWKHHSLSGRAMDTFFDSGGKTCMKNLNELQKEGLKTFSK